jgi:hypothetical protein
LVTSSLYSQPLYFGVWRSRCEHTKSLLSSLLFPGYLTGLLFIESRGRVHQYPLARCRRGTAVTQAVNEALAAQLPAYR